MPLPSLAHLRRADVPCECPLIGVDRKSWADRQNDENGPKRCGAGQGSGVTNPLPTRCAMPLQPRYRAPPASARTYISFFVVVLFVVLLVFFAAFLAADISELPSASGWSTVAFAFASTEDLVS